MTVSYTSIRISEPERLQTNKDATSRLGELDRIAHQIAQGSAEKQAITEYRGVLGNRVNAYSLAQRGMFVLAARLPQDLLDPHRRELQASTSFSKAQRGQDLLKLLFEPVNRALTGTQTSQFGNSSGFHDQAVRGRFG